MMSNQEEYNFWNNNKPIFEIVHNMSRQQPYYFLVVEKVRFLYLTEVRTHKCHKFVMHQIIVMKFNF